MAGLSHPLSDFEYEFPDDDAVVDDDFPVLNKSGATESSSSRQSITSQSSGSSSKNKYLWNVAETVEPLRPEQVRWFYKEVGNKNWTPFIGYDSLRIECKYREVLHSEKKSKQLSSKSMFENEEKICVRGSLYEVSVLEKKCYPIYWHHQDQTSEIMRGTWFKDSSWHPIEENICEEIEREHLVKFKGQTIQDTTHLENGKGSLPVLHTLQFDNFYIEWNANSLISLHYHKTSSKLYRAIGRQFGMTTNMGRRLQRGFFCEALIDDKAADIGHLVFVVHGIGQKMQTGNIVHRCAEFRETCQKMKEKHMKELESTESSESFKRAEFLPVEWRTSLKLDGDIVESITPSKMFKIRSLLNSSAMDIMYYTSPLYRSEITQGLQKELNRLYDMFCQRTPYFQASNGKVSVIAHSLGSVIMYDIITGWNPIQLYDQYVSRVIDTTCAELGETGDSIVEELDVARKHVADLEKQLFSLAEKKNIRTPSLKFTLTSFFCLGSPLAVFLALRGTRPRGGGTHDHILPKTLCARLFNIYHPYDPVAYRLEPLIIKAYGTIAPLKIFRHDSTSRSPYDSLPAVALSKKHADREEKNVFIDDTKEEPNNNTDELKSAKSSPEKKTPEKLKKDTSSSWGSFFRRKDKQKDKVVAEMSSMESSATSSSSPSDSPVKERGPPVRFTVAPSEGSEDSDSADIEMATPESPVSKLFTEAFLKEDKNDVDMFDIPDCTELEYRLDYQLHEGKMENAYWSALTSHTSYWTNQDVALFILQHLHPDIEPS